MILGFIKFQDRRKVKIYAFLLYIALLVYAFLAAACDFDIVTGLCSALDSIMSFFENIVQKICPKCRVNIPAAYNFDLIAILRSALDDIMPNFEPFLNRISPKSKGNMTGAFNMLWSVAVTVTIFILEISEEYRYGISLKRIVSEALGNLLLLVNVFTFLVLFPFFYVCLKFELMTLGFWCLCAAFIIFVETIAFFAWMYKGRNARSIISAKTLEQIKDVAKKEKRKKARKKRLQLHATIDAFVITDMLNHIDYGYADEVRELVNMCNGIFSYPKFWKKLKESTLENLMITTWVDHIIHKCEWNTEYDRIQNCNTLHLLWNEIISTVDLDSEYGGATKKKRKEQNKNAFDRDSITDQIKISICVQFLQPFINENDALNDGMFIRIWREFGIFQKQTLVYLLLYTFYRSCRVGTCRYTWILQDDSAFTACMREIINGRFWWNKSFAMQCWVDWSRYDCLNNVEFTQFKTFSDDMEKLQDGKKYKVLTPIIIQLIKGVQ